MTLLVTILSAKQLMFIQ